MTRPVVMSLGAAVLLACGSKGEQEAVLPETTTIVSDSNGLTYGGATVSPDGTRLAWGQTVRGRSVIFAGNADGSGRVQLTHGVWDSGPVWSPDGRWIAYNAESPDFDLMLVSADGRETRQLTSGPPYDLPWAWLPDGSGVVFSRGPQGNADMMVAPLDGGSPRSLTPGQAGARIGAVSPDGRFLAYRVQSGKAEGTIWLRELPDGEPRQVTTDGFEAIDPEAAWSPDSRQVLYQSRRTGTYDLWVMDVGSGEHRQLTTDIQDDWAGRWSPEGHQIAFLSNRGGQYDVWIVSPDGGTAVRMTNDEAREEDLRWSPDGMTLLYEHNSSGSALTLLSVDGGENQVILAWPDHSIEDAELLPDGSAAVFQSKRSGTVGLWRVSTQGGEATPFAPASGFDSYDPHPSPNGSDVLFLSDRGGSVDLWIAGIAGGEPRRLTTGPATEFEGEWSPDGSLIAFVSNRDATGQDVWVMPAGGGEATRVSRGHRLVSDVEWSRDGRFVLFVAQGDGGVSDLYRVAASGGTPQSLGAARGVGNLEVSPDGRTISYSSFEGGWAYLDVIPAAGGKPRRLTPRTEDTWQNWAIWTPDGASLVVRDLDFAGNRDASDLFVVRVADNSWRQLTKTLVEDETPVAFMPDGKRMLVLKTTQHIEVRAARLKPLLDGKQRADRP